MWQSWVKGIKYCVKVYITDEPKGISIFIKKCNILIFDNCENLHLKYANF